MKLLFKPNYAYRSGHIRKYENEEEEKASLFTVFNY